MAEEAEYSLYVDWNGDGDFGDAGEDVSDDWVMADITRGFSGLMARLPGVGRATFELLNLSRQYSPELDADLLPRRAVRFDVTYGGSTVTRFRGFLDSIVPDSGQYERRRARLNCVDAMALMDGYEGEIALQTDVYADDLIEDVVDAVYTAPATSYQAGLNLFPVSADQWSYETPGQIVEEIKASGKLGDICTGDWGHFFIASDGTPTYYNRHQMPLDATTELTLDNTMHTLDYGLAVSSVFNYVEVTCYPRAVGTSVEVLGRISQDKAPVVPEGGELTLIVKFRDSANQKIKLGGQNCLTPVAGTDFLCTNDPGGEGTNVNADITPTATFYGDYGEITLANAGAVPAYLQRLKVRGYGVRTREAVTVVSQDATSITAYQKRKLRVSAVLMSNTADAQNLADYLVARYKDPRPVVAGLSITGNVNATLMAACRDLELCDRVVISEQQTGLSSYAGYVANLKEHITPLEHRLSFALMPGYDVGTPFRLDISQLDSGDVLIY